MTVLPHNPQIVNVQLTDALLAVQRIFSASPQEDDPNLLRAVAALGDGCLRWNGSEVDDDSGDREAAG